MKNFWGWLAERSESNVSRFGLYPLGYGGLGLYPPQEYLARAPDALYYMTTSQDSPYFIVPSDGKSKKSKGVSKAFPNNG